MLGEEGIINGDDELLGRSKKQKLKAPSSSKANDVTNKQLKQKQPHNKKKTTLSSWQPSLLSQHSFSSQSNKNKKSKSSSSSVSSFNTSKKKSSTTMSKMRSTNNNMKNTEMWIDKHAPRTIKELCVAPKKIDEVRNFLSSHISYTAYQRKQKQKQQTQSNNSTTNPLTNYNPWEMSNKNIQPTPPQTKLMILVGSSGIGKSTMIKTLAREMNIEIITWNDIHVDYNMSHDIDGGGGMAYLPYQSQLHSFEEFLKSGGVGMKSLDLLVGDDDDDDSSFENQSVKRRKGGGKMGNIDTHKEYVGSLILVEEVSFILLQVLNFMPYPHCYPYNCAQRFQICTMPRLHNHFGERFQCIFLITLMIP